MRNDKKLVHSLFASVAAACVLAGCGGGGDEGAPASASPAPAGGPPAGAPSPSVSSTCSSLHSGLYRVIVPSMSAPGEFATERLTVDAATGVTVALDDPTDRGQLTPTGNCTYTLDNGGEMVVSSAGLAVFRSNEGGVMRLGLAFHEQTIPLADLAGDWQMIGMERDSAGSYGAMAGAATLNSSGAITLTRYCPTLQTCAPVGTPPSLTLQTNAGGGFNLVQPGNDASRTFAFRAYSGDLMLVDLAGNGSFSIWGRQRTLTPPAVNGRAFSLGIWAGPALTSTAAMSTSDFTTTAVDAAAGTFTRVSNLDGHSETVTLNTPYAGYSRRAEGTATNSSGGTVTVREFTSLPIQGFGLSVLAMPSLGGGALFLSTTPPAAP